MPEPHPRKLISSDLLRLLRQYAPDTAAPSGSDALPDQIPLDEVLAVWQAAALASRDPYFGLHFGADVPRLLAGQLFSAVMLNSPSLGAALERFCRYHGLLANGRPPQLSAEADQTVILFNPADLNHRSLGEAVLAMTTAFVAQISAGQVRPLAVHCPFGQAADRPEYERVFGGPAVFEPGAPQVRYRTTDLARSILLADPGLLARLEEYAQIRLDRLGIRGGWAQQVGAILWKKMLAGEKPDLNRVCRELAVSPRSLQKHLQNEGTSYHALTDRTRFEMACELLSQPANSICQAAFVLGYADQSAFNHAFKRWSGMTPQEYRQRSDPSNNVK